MDLSIIVPCYGVEAYLAECLDSACALPPERVEILCVDDASPDGSAGILTRYAARYPNLRVLPHVQNLGLSAARNTGLDNAAGEYVLFLDADDLIRPAHVLPLLDQARDGRLDILQGACECFADGTGAPLPAPPTPHPTGVMTGDACLALLCAKRTFEPMTVIRLYRRAFLEEQCLRMAEGLLFEDELFTAPAFLRARRVQVAEAVFYRYRRRPGSIMDGFRKSVKWCADYLTIARRLSALCVGPVLTPGQRALRRRAAAIALSIYKNIEAHGLQGPVRREAECFAHAHGREIGTLAMGGGSPVLWAQGALLRISPALFQRAYGAQRRLRAGLGIGAT